MLTFEREYFEPAGIWTRHAVCDGPDGRKDYD